MIGNHLATSIGGALPGSGGADSFVGQVLLTGKGQVATVPTGAPFAFIEVQAKGGAVGGSTQYASAGGAASDIILAVIAGKSIVANLLSEVQGAETSSIVYDGATVISANSPPISSAPTQSGPSGKYPGGSATSAISPGRGGGRLAGLPDITSPFGATGSIGVGSGRRSTGVSVTPSSPAVGCATFFRSYDAALAFANSLYGGNWQP